jgi:hypothetical protein
MSDDETRLVPSDVDLKLRLAIFRLLDTKYRPHFGTQSKFLCAGIFNWAFREEPVKEDARDFLEKNKDLIVQEAMSLHLDRELNLAFSILYAFTLIRLGPKHPERSLDLVERGTELNIVILSEKEICPTDDAIQFLAFIDKYADRLLRA